MTDPNLVRQKKLELKAEIVSMRKGLELIHDPRRKAVLSMQIDEAERFYVASKPMAIAGLNKMLGKESDPAKRAAIQESIRIVNED